MRTQQNTIFSQIPDKTPMIIVKTYLFMRDIDVTIYYKKQIFFYEILLV